MADKLDPLTTRLPDKIDEDFCKTALGDLWNKGLSEAYKNLPHNEDGSISAEAYVELSKIDPYQARIMDANLFRNEYPKEKIDGYKSELEAGRHCSLMAKYITEEMFNKYKDTLSGGSGNWTFSRAINTGVMFPWAYMGIHAGDPESYDTFIEIYKPCVESYHKGFVWDEEHAHRTDLDPNNLSVSFSDDAKSLIVSTRIRVARNLGGTFRMNPNGDASSREEVLALVREAAANFDDDLKGTVFAHATMTPEEEQALIDDHFLFKGRDMRQAACGYHEYWPAGRGIFQAKDKQFNMWINEGDHLRVMVMTQTPDIVGVLGKLARGVACVEREVARVTNTDKPFARHPILGMVTCCPTNLGTGCRASVHLDIPNLVSKLGIHGIDEICDKHKCQARGSTGEFSEVTQGARVDISNKYRLGYSEVQLVEHMINTVNILAEMEMAIGMETKTPLPPEP